jgi:regulator of replication initiation timing
MGVALCKPCTLPELEAAQPLTLMCDSMTDEQTSNESQGELDPLTTLAAEFEELKRNYESLVSEVKKIRHENTQLLETNRKLVASKVEENVVEPKEPDIEEIMLKKFYNNLGIQKMEGD